MCNASCLAPNNPGLSCIVILQESNVPDIGCQDTLWDMGKWSLKNENSLFAWSICGFSLGLEGEFTALTPLLLLHVYVLRSMCAQLRLCLTKVLPANGETVQRANKTLSASEGVGETKHHTSFNLFNTYTAQKH